MATTPRDTRLALLNHVYGRTLAPGVRKREIDPGKTTPRELHQVYGDLWPSLYASDWQCLGQKLTRECPRCDDTHRAASVVATATPSSGGGTAAPPTHSAQVIAEADQRLRDTALLSLGNAVSTLPSIENVRQRLGEQAAADYRALREDLETSSHVPIDTSNERRMGTAHIADILALLPIAAIRDREEAIDAYLSHVEQRRNVIRNRKRSLRENNRPVARVAKRLCVWFPYKTDEHRWLGNEHTAVVFSRWKAGIASLRILLKRYRRLIQYVQRRRFSMRAVEDVERNIATIESYVATPALLHEIVERRGGDGDGDGDDDDDDDSDSDSDSDPDMVQQ